LECRSDGSGKGINVAIALRQIKEGACCIGFLPETGKSLIEQRLKHYDVAYSFLYKKGSVRTNLKIVETDSDRMTEINESGVEVSESDIQTLRRMVREESSQTQLMIFSGSVPPGCPDNIYETLIKDAKNVPCILDAEGEKLAQGLKAKPLMIKPNQYELELLLGKKLSNIQEVAEGARQLRERGAAIVTVSMGDQGALMACPQGVYYSPAITVPVKSTVGAGDCMVAGISKAYISGLPYPEMLKWGVACATACVVTDGSLLMDGQNIQAFLPKVKITQL
jgi:1-phosphofructokinase